MNKEKVIWLLKNSMKITTEEFPDSVFYYMNKNIERQIKLHKVLDIYNPIQLDLNKINKYNIIFEQDIKTKILWIDYYKIWSNIESNKEYKGMNINKIVGGWLKDDTNWKLYTPLIWLDRLTGRLKDDTNWKIYTP